MEQLHAPETGWINSLRQSEHRERSAERGIVAKASVTADGAETGGVHVPRGGFQCTAYSCTARSALPFSGSLGLISPAAKPIPAQPPTPDSTATYCLPPCS